MKLLPAACVSGLIMSVSVASAQQPRVPKAPSPPPAPAVIAPTLQTPPPAHHFTPPSLSAPQVTPELWVYSQELQRHDDPAQAVRRKSEAKADQRLSRLAALKWYGQSNSRPDACPIPLMSSYSPTWTGNGWDRYGWTAISGPSLTLQIDPIISVGSLR